MRTIGWSGPGPSRAVAARLQAAGLHVDREDRDGLPLVVATASAAKVPTPAAERGRWLWLANAAVPAPRAADAVIRGAYDVVSLAGPGALDTLVARCDEMLTPEPAAPI